MANWYCFKDAATLKVVSYTSDDSATFVLSQPGMVAVGPYVSQAAAVAVNQPTVATSAQQVMSTLQAKPTATWTLQDVADWLKAKG